MRPVLVLFILVGTAHPAAAPDLSWYRRLVRFDHSYQRLIHTACGWPEKLTELDPKCDPWAGHTDGAEFQAARGQVCEFFQVSCK